MSKIEKRAVERLDEVSGSLEGLAALLIRAKEEIVFTEKELCGVGMLCLVLARHTEETQKMISKQF